MTSRPHDDVRPGDVALAVMVASLTLVAMYVALVIARNLPRDTQDPDARIPIRVRPVLDLAVPKPLGGAASPPTPPPPATTPPPPTSTPPSKPPPPRKTKPDPSKPTQPLPPEPPPEPAGEPTPPTDPPPLAGESDGDGEPGRGRDPLGDKAIAAYRERLIRWLSARFEVRGSGLTREQLETMRVRAQIDISEDGRVTEYKILTADHPAFDAAARTALDAVKGEPVPPPPEFYPGALQRRIKVTFVCSDSTCD